MIKSKSEILDAIKNKFNGDTSDETIGLIEDISDTMGLNGLETEVRGERRTVETEVHG